MSTSPGRLDPLKKPGELGPPHLQLVGGCGYIVPERYKVTESEEALSHGLDRVWASSQNQVTGTILQTPRSPNKQGCKSIADQTKKSLADKELVNEMYLDPGEDKRPRRRNKIDFDFFRQKKSERHEMIVNDAATQSIYQPTCTSPRGRVVHNRKKDDYHEAASALLEGVRAAAKRQELAAAAKRRAAFQSLGIGRVDEDIESPGSPGSPYLPGTPYNEVATTPREQRYQKLALKAYQPKKEMANVALFAATDDTKGKKTTKKEEEEKKKAIEKKMEEEKKQQQLLQQQADDDAEVGAEGQQEGAATQDGAAGTAGAPGEGGKQIVTRRGPRNCPVAIALAQKHMTMIANDGSYLGKLPGSEWKSPADSLRMGYDDYVGKRAVEWGRVDVESVEHSPRVIEEEYKHEPTYMSLIGMPAPRRRKATLSKLSSAVATEAELRHESHRVPPQRIQLNYDRKRVKKVEVIATKAKATTETGKAPKGKAKTRHKN